MLGDVRGTSRCADDGVSGMLACCTARFRFQLLPLGGLPTPSDVLAAKRHRHSSGAASRTRGRQQDLFKSTAEAAAARALRITHSSCINLCDPAPALSCLSQLFSFLASIASSCRSTAVEAETASATTWEGPALRK